MGNSHFHLLRKHKMVCVNLCRVNFGYVVMISVVSVLQHKRSHRTLELKYHWTLSWDSTNTYTTCSHYQHFCPFIELKSEFVPFWALLLKCRASLCKADVFWMRSTIQFTYSHISHQSCHLSQGRLKQNLKRSEYWKTNYFHGNNYFYTLKKGHLFNLAHWKTHFSNYF